MAGCKTTALVPDVLQHRVPRAEADRVLAHVEQCAECRTIRDMYTLLQDGFAAEGQGEIGEAHADSETLVRFAGREGALVENDRQLAERHAKACETCGGDVARIRQSMADLAPADFSAARAATQARKRAWMPAALTAAAGIALGVLIGPLLMRGREAPTPDWETTSPLWVLSNPVRSREQPVQVVEIQPSLKLFMIAIEPPFAQPGPGDERVRLSVEKASGSVVWRAEETRATFLERAVSSGVVTIHLPTSKLPDGRYEVVIEALDSPPESGTFHYPFQVRRSAPGGS